MQQGPARVPTAATCLEATVDRRGVETPLGTGSD